MDDRRLDRKNQKAVEKTLKPLLDEAPEKEMTFWCDSCRRDFISTGFKACSLVPGERPLVWYQVMHDCGRECIRRWTERPDDEYYDLSEMIRLERETYADDMLSPRQRRFKTLYKDQADEKRGEENLEVEARLYDNFKVEGAGSSTPKELREYQAIYGGT